MQILSRPSFMGCTVIAFPPVVPPMGFLRPQPDSRTALGAPTCSNSNPALPGHCTPPAPAHTPPRHPPPAPPAPTGLNSFETDKWPPPSPRPPTPRTPPVP